MSFEIKLPLFEGPFDLLLFFIERDELDIYDIPIYRITADFLAYVHQLNEMDMELASEFILVAATLMRIKSRTLLPRKELDLEGNEIDPRDELVRHLLEYKRYKGVLEELRNMEAERAALEPRGNLKAEVKLLSEQSQDGEELHHLDLYRLLKVYQRVMERHEIASQRPTHQVVPFPYTIEEQKSYLLGHFATTARVSFEQLILEMPDKIAAIFNFLAILELIQLGLISIQVGEGYNNFWITEKQDLADAD